MSLASRGTSLPRIGRRFGLRENVSTVGDFVSLMKPRVMSLVVFTAFVGLFLAPGQIDPSLAVIVIVCIAVGAGGAGVLNMWYDADVDIIMTRTASRAIPSGRVSRREAFVFCILLAVSAVGVLGIVSNMVAAALLAFTIFFYAVIYTIWLKRRTPQNIVIGGAAGALPPVIGWVAITGHMGVEPFVLFLIIFLWTPPHFWALALNHAGDYARAGIPMLPVVAGKPETKKQILIYSVLLLPVVLLPWILGLAGMVYGAAAAILGTIFIVFAVRLRSSSIDSERGAAGRMFAFSIVYLFVLFALLLADGAVGTT